MPNIAMYSEPAGSDTVICGLCPHRCTLQPGQKGICRVRYNLDGILISASYGRLSAIHADPIEKKPLYHFYPGQSILSVGSIGCNLRCSFCQNWEISQEFNEIRNIRTPEEIAEMSDREEENIGIAYTYNEPVVYYEFMLDTAQLVREKGKKNVMVTNGFIEPAPLSRLFSWIDAFSVDLKGFNSSFFRKYTRSALEPVKQSLIQIAQAGKHLEITSLIIPGANDDREDFMHMVHWIGKELGEETVLHLSRYFPQYKLKIPPTPEELMLNLYSMASGVLKYVYLGNVSGEGKEHDTHCPECNHLLIQRSGYSTRITGLDDTGHCRRCGKKIPVHIK